MPDDKYYKDAPEDERPNEDVENNEGYAEDDQNGESEGEDTELEQLLGFLESTLTAAPAMPLNNNKRIVSLQMCLNIVEDIRNCLPDEIRYSSEIIKRRDRILRDAQAAADAKSKAAEARANAAIDDANSRAQSIVNDAEDHAADIIEQAETRARAMIDQSEITRLAHEEANQICEEARAAANDTRLQATRYAEALLQGLEGDVQSTLDALRESLKGIAERK